MAKNLRAKIPKSDTLVICDLNADVTKKFAAEVNGLGVEIAASPKELAEKSVRRYYDLIPEKSRK
jgi:3-hydroxyisobutyrate dehydrogenase